MLDQVMSKDTKLTTSKQSVATATLVLFWLRSNRYIGREDIIVRRNDPSRGSTIMRKYNNKVYFLVLYTHSKSLTQRAERNLNLSSKSPSQTSHNHSI